MIITNIIEKRKSVYSVYIDGVYAFDLSDNVLSEFNLKINMEISKDLNNTIIEKYIYPKAKDKALIRLSIRIDTKYSVYNFLIRKGFNEDISLRVTNELENKGYLNDDMFARKYIYDRIKNNPKSKKQIFFELRKKGVSKEIITTALDEIEVDEFEIALNLAKKRVKNLALDNIKEKEKIFRYLRYRGFNVEIIRKVIDNIT